MKFCEKLIELRKKEGLSQEELGYKLNVTRQTISKWELGQTTPEMDKLVELSSIFGISVDNLIKDVEIEKTTNSDQEAVIEDRPIKEKKTNNKKTIIIVIALVIVVFFIYQIIMVRNVFNFLSYNEDGFESVFQQLEETQNEAKNQNEENQNSVSEQITQIQQMQNEVIDQMQQMQEQNMNKITENQEIIDQNKENIEGNIEEINKEIEETENKIMQAQKEFEVKRFNSQFAIYEGTKNAGTIRSILERIIINNKQENRKVIVKYLDKETADTVEIKNIKANFEGIQEYEVSFEYDAEGYIYLMSIE